MTIKLEVTFSPRISKENFVNVHAVGSGGFGTCYKAVYKPEKLVCCVKKINRTSKKKAALQSFQAETKQEFFTFKHPNIVKLLAATPVVDLIYDELEDLFMAFEYIEGRNLQRLLEDDTELIDINRMCRFGYEIASALAYVHSNGIVHLDVKPSNIMVTRQGKCKLADFGCSQYRESDPVESESLLTGTFAYRAPELHRGLSPTPKCDVYALGICLWQFWSRRMPFSGTPQHVVIYNVVRNNLRPTFSNANIEIDEEYKQLSTQCWSANPNERPELCTLISSLQRISYSK